jgi:uncharacterized UBP type Zn finger protein
VNPCAHLQSASISAEAEVAAKEAGGCPECLAQGHHDWVHLRQCLTCGQVGCCDSSPRKHASEHYAATGHPVMRSLEPGDVWKWCFLDEAIG